MLSHHKIVQFTAKKCSLLSCISLIGVQVIISLHLHMHRGSPHSHWLLVVLRHQGDAGMFGLDLVVHW